jgi:hypothetical protein
MYESPDEAEYDAKEEVKKSTKSVGKARTNYNPLQGNKSSLTNNADSSSDMNKGKGFDLSDDYLTQTPYDAQKDRSVDSLASSRKDPEEEFFRLTCLSIKIKFN